VRHREDDSARNETVSRLPNRTQSGRRSGGPACCRIADPGPVAGTNLNLLKLTLRGAAAFLENSLELPRRHCRGRCLTFVFAIRQQARESLPGRKELSIVERRQFLPPQGAPDEKSTGHEEHYAEKQPSIQNARRVGGSDKYAAKLSVRWNAVLHFLGGKYANTLLTVFPRPCHLIFCNVILTPVVAFPS
jgi:hypothetical protein